MRHALILFAIAATGCRAPSELPAEPPAPDEPSECDVILGFNPIYFAAGEATLNREARLRLDENLHTLRACPDLRVTVWAFADGCTPVEGYGSGSSMSVSQARADSVAQYYVQEGASLAQVYRHEGMGTDARPGVACEDPEPRGRRAQTDVLTPSRQWHFENRRPPGSRPTPIPDSVRRADSTWMVSRRGRSLLQVYVPEEPVVCEIVPDLHPVYFASGSAELGAAARERLLDNVLVLNRCTGSLVAVRAFASACDPEDRAAPDSLSQARAYAVARFYHRLGVPHHKQMRLVEGAGEAPRRGTPCDGAEPQSRRADTIPFGATTRTR